MELETVILDDALPQKYADDLETLHFSDSLVVFSDFFSQFLSELVIYIYYIYMFF